MVARTNLNVSLKKKFFKLNKIKKFKMKHYIYCYVSFLSLVKKKEHFKA
jgi:hypothetical protein